MDNNYEINEHTMAIISDDFYNSKILEEETEYLISINSTKIIDQSCRYFGSSYKGRHEGTKSLIGFSHKAPIIIEESREIVFFPTISPRLSNCNWISLNKIKDYKKHNTGTEVIFINNQNLILDISFGSFQNQLLRASRLAAVLRDRKYKK